MIRLHVISPEEMKQTFDISELFGMQKELDKRIGYKGNDKSKKRKLNQSVILTKRAVSIS
ncbi:hypothetical protein BACCIP111899_02667 [Bacillus rhizoplanae]|uniref:Uncharacterized protein n=1 Tax=Bacillus rhizoplanae TaxID=2880966 RepID=A0ABN7ZXM9_9BACI|nr:hypothetical protein BACCIP111899_02667 [Bacillus rhizoplanae]